MSALPQLTLEEKEMRIAYHMRAILETLGLDLDETPERVARMYVHELFWGLNEENFPSITLMDAPSSHPVTITNIRVNSFCEHHLVPMMGTAKVAYIPRGKIIGLSKINRIVHFYSARPQLQERLTTEILDRLKQVLGTPDVAVSITAQHTCVTLRGCKDEESCTTTHALSGCWQELPFRSEFLTL